MAYYRYTLENQREFLDVGIYNVDYQGEWLKLHPDGRCVIPAGYAWDGVSPVFFRFSLFGFDFVLKMPEGVIDPRTKEPYTKNASLVHDTLLQHLDELGITRKQARDAMLRIADADGFVGAPLMYWAVRVYDFVWYGA